MTPTSTMTLSEFLEKDPHLYDGAKGYNFNPETQRWEETAISQSTKDLLFEEFCDRYVNNDAKFKRLYIKKINGLALRYANLRRNELTVFDPLVADYMERQEISQASTTHLNEKEDSSTKTTESDDTSQGSKSGGENNESTNVSDPQVIQFKEETRTPDLTDQTITSGEADESASEHSDDRVVNKQAPMSAEYAGATAGEIPKLNWRSLTAQQQSDHDGSNSKHSENDETQTHTQGGTEKHESKEWSTGVDTVTDEAEKTWNEEDTGSDHREGSETAQGTQSESGSSSENKDARVIQTGRGGLTPQEALSRANEFIKGSSAAAWLKKELQVCFRCVTYNPDEEWMY